jgi:hypothetical protein
MRFFSTHISHHATAMLTYPDRQKFEQIRARWETIRQGEDGPAEMVGWREKPAAQPPVGGEPLDNGGSKFRRKLSHGLAFISNPLSQRKTTPGRHQNVPVLAVTEPSATDLTARITASDAHQSPARKSTSPKHCNGSAKDPTTPPSNALAIQSPGSDATPRPLPRSRTLSFIPLPVKAEPKSFAAEVEGAVKAQSLEAMSQPKPDLIPSKIPTPSPPEPERRRSSPRQYLHQHASYHASQQIKHIAAAHAFAAANNGSPARYPLRSRTTPNFVNGHNAVQSARFMAPRRPGPKRTTTSPITQKPILQENIPTDRRVTQRRSQIQEKTTKRESLAVAGTLNNRRSFGSGAQLAQSRPSSFATPPTARKRESSHLAQQTPVTAKRVHSEEQAKSQAPKPSPIKTDSSVTQPCAMGPPPTPTPQAPDLAKPTLPRSNTDKDLQRKTLGTPNGLAGVWRSSRALAVTTHEVSGLPRSQTFHDFGIQREAAPPVPPIPEQYRTPSLSNLTQHLRMGPNTAAKTRHIRLLSNATTEYESIPEESDEEVRSRTPISTPPPAAQDRPSSVKLSDFVTSLTALPSAPSTPKYFFAASSTTAGLTPPRLPSDQSERPWSISDQQGSDNADGDSIFQVKDYMPPLYWAGRFQSRYDQWRTDAMITELNLNTDHQPSSSLSECTLNQEKLAACYIFEQLRDLCTSNQAADSLWVCGSFLFLILLLF